MCFSLSVMTMGTGAGSVSVLLYPQRLIQSLAHSAYSKQAAELITENQEKAEFELSFEDR